MNDTLLNLIEVLSHPFVIFLFICIIVYCIWYRKSGQDQREKDEQYKNRKLELQCEREKLEQAKADFEQRKDAQVVYVKESCSDKTVLLVLLIISIILNIYFFDKLQEYYHMFGELKEMADILKTFLQ